MARVTSTESGLDLRKLSDFDQMVALKRELDIVKPEDPGYEQAHQLSGKLNIVIQKMSGRSQGEDPRQLWDEGKGAIRQAKEFFRIIE